MSQNESLHVRWPDGQEGAVLSEDFGNPDLEDRFDGAKVLRYEDGREYDGPTTARGMVQRLEREKSDRPARAPRGKGSGATREKTRGKSGESHGQGGTRGRSGETHGQSAEPHGHRGEHGGGRTGTEDDDAGDGARAEQQAAGATGENTDAVGPVDPAVGAADRGES